MSIETIIEAGVQAFKEQMVTHLSDSVEGELTPALAHTVTLAVQQAIAAAGAGAFCAFLESKETAADVVCHGGETYRFKYASDKTFGMLWGQRAVSRRVFQNASDTKTHVPLDVAWGMAGESMTVEVREAVAFACAHVTAEEAHALLKKSALFQPHPTQMKEVVMRLGAQVKEREEELNRRIREGEAMPQGVRVLAASLDGANVLMREPGAKRGRPAERPIDRTQSDDTAYRNAMAGTVSVYGAVPEGEKRPQRLQTRYASHMPEDHAPTFKGKFERELAVAEAQLPPGAVKVLICDGARALWKYAKNNKRFDGYEKLVDYWHTLEHLSLAAEALFDKSTKEANAWYDQYADKLLDEDDGAARVLRSMDYHARTQRLSPTRRKNLSKQRVYFVNNGARMRYAEFRRRGLPIGSGPVEAACKSLIKTRLCRSGMRWSKDGGQAVLDLRTYVKSNRWDSFWKHINELREVV
jgi:hypothetical protein